MASVYNFTINRKMLISSWDEGIAELTGSAASVAMGQKYYNVFPRLLHGDRDAVAFVIEKNRKLVLKKYIFHCLFYRVTADVIIKPLSAVKKNIGAAIEVSHVSTCDGYRPEDIQRLIATPKIATPSSSSRTSSSFAEPREAKPTVGIESVVCCRDPDGTIVELIEYMGDRLGSRIDDLPRRG